jgi:hypothetical protein
MERKEDEIYLAKIEEIRLKVYEFFKMSDRSDLIMVYEMQEEKIYSYIYEDYMNSLVPKSKAILKKQYQEAQASDEIVLFIKDNLRKKMKSFNI